MLRKLFNVKTSSTVEKTSESRLSPIELILDGKLDQHQLYLFLNNNGKSKLIISDSYGGFGHIFQKKTRHKLIASAFRIDDTLGSESASIENLDELIVISKSFKKGDIHGIKSNEFKYVISLALIFSNTYDLKLKKKIANQLELIYQDTHFRCRHDSASVLQLIQKKMLETKSKAEPEKINEPPLLQAVIDRQENQSTTKPLSGDDGLPPLFLNRDNISIRDNNNTLLLVNAIRKILVNDIENWKLKTPGTAFFIGGTKVVDPNPNHAGQFIRVPNGIAKMLRLLGEKNYFTQDITDVNDATLLVQSFIRIALERFQLGNRSLIRSKETNRFYMLLTCLTSSFNSHDMRAIKNINPTHAEVDLSNNCQDLIQEIQSLFKYSDHSDFIILRKQ